MNIKVTESKPPEVSKKYRVRNLTEEVMMELETEKAR